MVEVGIISDDAFDRYFAYDLEMGWARSRSIELAGERLAAHLARVEALALRVKK